MSRDRQELTALRCFPGVGLSNALLPGRAVRRNSKDYERRTDSSESMMRVSQVQLMLHRLSPIAANNKFNYRNVA